MLGSWLGHAVRVSALRVQSIFVWSVSSSVVWVGLAQTLGESESFFRKWNI